MGNKIIGSPPIQETLSFQETPTIQPKIPREAATHHRTPDSPWYFPRPVIFAPSPQLVEIRREYFQETDTTPLHPVVYHPYTSTAPDMTVLTKASGKYQGPPPPIPTPATAPMLMSQCQPSLGRTHQYYGPHCRPLGPPIYHWIHHGAFLGPQCSLPLLNV